MTTHYNREDVDRRLARLREEYEDVRVREDRTALPAAEFEQFRALSADGYTGGGYAWVVRHPDRTPALSESMPDDATEDRPHVLLILHRGETPGWTLPGGTREDGETYEEATVREVREETGIESDLEAPYLAYRGRYTAEDGDDYCLHALWVYFDATYSSGHLEIQPGELRGAAWFLVPPGRLAPNAADRAGDWWDDYEPDDT